MHASRIALGAGVLALLGLTAMGFTDRSREEIVDFGLVRVGR